MAIVSAGVGADIARRRTGPWMGTVRRSILAALLLTGLGCVGERPDAPVASLVALEPLETPAGPGSAEPNLTSADGRAYLSWLEPSDSGHTLRYATLDDGAWGEARTIVTGGNLFVNWADFPSLVPMPNGSLAAHWLERDGESRGSYGVRVALAADEQALTPHRDTSAVEHGFVSMWSEGDTLALAWLDGQRYARPDGQQMMLLSTTVAPDGSLGPERVVDERTCDCCQTAVAMTPRGPLVAYRDRSPGEIRDIYVSRFEGGAWTAPRPVHADGWEVNFCPVNGPAVAARGESVAVAWFTAARDTARVQVAFSQDAGDSFGAPLRLDGGSPVGRVGVVMLGDGSALVTWIERTGGEAAEVLARRVFADGRMDAPVPIATSSAERASGFPRVAISGDTVLFAWTGAGGVRSARARVPAS